MKTNRTLFLKGLILISIVAGLDLAAGLIFPLLLSKQKSGSYFLINHAIKDCNEDILIFGNSHTSQHFDTPLMTRELDHSTFNFGIRGQSMIFSYTMAEVSLRHHNPKIIVLNLDRDALKQDISSYQRLSIFLPYSHTSSLIDSSINLISKYENIASLSNLYRFNSTFGYIALKAKSNSFGQSKQSRGYDPTRGVNICTNKFLIDGAENDIEQLDKVDTVKVSLLKNLITDCIARKITLIIVTTPIVSAPSEFTSESYLALKAIVSKNHLPYFDAYNNETFTGDCKLFYDKTHMNDVGAQVWSRVFDEYLIQNGFIKL